MAIPFLNNINLSGNELQNAKLHISTVGPTYGKGVFYLDSTAGVNKLKYNNGSGFLTVLDTSMVDGTSIEIASNALSLVATGVSANTYGSATAIPVITVDADGRLTNVTTASIQTSFSITDGFTTETVAGGDTITFTGTTNEVTVAVSATDTVTIGLPDDVTIGGTLTVTDQIDMSSTKIINLATPTAGTDAATKAYVDSAVTGALSYQGGYNASTNSPDLDTTPSSSINKGWTYTVTADGLFFTEQVRTGDVLIAENDSPTTLGEWTIVQSNVDLADASTIGLGNVAAGSGIGVSYSSGTATISNSGVTSITAGTGISVNQSTGSVTITASNTGTQYVATISASATVNHNLGTRDVIVQLYDTATYDTVYADVVRTDTNNVAVTFSSTPTNSIRVLITKIG